MWICAKNNPWLVFCKGVFSSRFWTNIPNWQGVGVGWRGSGWGFARSYGGACNFCRPWFSLTGIPNSWITSVQNPSVRFQSYCDRCLQSLSPNFCFFPSFGLAPQQQRLPHFWLSMSSELFYLWVCGSGDLEYWVHAHVLCILLGFWGGHLSVSVWDMWTFDEIVLNFIMVMIFTFWLPVTDSRWTRQALLEQKWVPLPRIFMCTRPLPSEPSVSVSFGL